MSSTPSRTLLPALLLLTLATHAPADEAAPPRIAVQAADEQAAPGWAALRLTRASRNQVDRGVAVALRLSSQALSSTLRTRAERATAPFTRLPADEVTLTRGDRQGKPLDARGWSAWYAKSIDAKQLFIVVRNDRDDANQPLPPDRRGRLDDQQSLLVRIPLSGANVALVDVFFSDRVVDKQPIYKTQGMQTLVCRPLAVATPPRVELKIKQLGLRPLSALRPGDQIEVEAHVDRCQQATLYGARSATIEGRTLRYGAATEQRLSPQGGACHLTQRVAVFDNITFELDSDVDAGGQQPLRVLRQADVAIDVQRSDAGIAFEPIDPLPGEYVQVYATVDPARVGPSDTVNIAWTGHDGNKRNRDCLTQDGRARICLVVPDRKQVSVTVGAGGGALHERALAVTRWEPCGDKGRACAWSDALAEAPVAIAAGGKQLLLATDRTLWRATVDGRDVDAAVFPPLQRLALVDAELAARGGLAHWLALSPIVVAGRRQLLALARMRSDDGPLLLFRFDEQGALQQPVATLPGAFTRLRHFALVTVGTRVYAVGYGAAPGAPGEWLIERAASLDVTAAWSGVETFVPEPLLSNSLLHGDWALTALGDSIYALDLTARGHDFDAGTLLRFGAATRPPWGGTLAFPTRARAAMPSRRDDGSRVTAANSVVLDAAGVLAVLGAGTGVRLQEQLRREQNLPLDCPLTDVTQDVAFNPQSSWTASGHSPPIVAGARAAYGDELKRIWLVQREAGAVKAYTLSLASPSVLARDWERGRCAQEDEWLGSEQPIRVVNRTAQPLVWSWDVKATLAWMSARPTPKRDDDHCRDQPPPPLQPLQARPLPPNGRDELVLRYRGAAPNVRVALRKLQSGEALPAKLSSPELGQLGTVGGVWKALGVSKQSGYRLCPAVHGTTLEVEVFDAAATCPAHRS